MARVNASTDGPRRAQSAASTAGSPSRTPPGVMAPAWVAAGGIGWERSDASGRTASLAGTPMHAVTVSVNSERDIAGLVANQPLLDSFERVVVVDNASTDRSAEIAREGGLEVVRSDERLGYGAALNMGARHVEGDFFVVMNPDIRFFDTETIPRLRHHFMHPQVGIVVPALELLDGTLQDSARRTPTPMNLIFRRWLSEGRGWTRRGGDVEWAVAAFWVVRRSAWEDVGGFDVGYFLYFEDVDICHRLRRRGWTIRFDPTVRVQHAFQAASRASFDSWAARQHLRSAVRFFVRNPRYMLDPRPTNIGAPEGRRVARLPERRQAPR